MDLRNMLNPISDATAQAQALSVQTPQRTHSLAAYPPQSSPTTPIYPSLPRTASLPATSHYRENSVSVSPKTMPPPAPMPHQLSMSTPSPTVSRKRSLSSISDHQQTPQPAPKKMRTPQPPSERNHTPQSTATSTSNSTSQSSQPTMRPRRYSQIPIWALKEADGHKHIPKRSEPISQQVAPSPVVENGAFSISPGGPSPPIRRSHMEVSLDNHEPYNDMSRLVANWLWDHVIAAPDYGPGTQIEVEAKLGELQANEVRIKLPILTEAVVAPGCGAKFKSSMRQDQHQRLNGYLNSAVRQANLPGRAPMAYKHTIETDTTFDLPSEMLARSSLAQTVKDAHLEGGKPARVRVTRDNKTDAITAAIIKLRRADLEIICPSDDFDIRISVSLETVWPHPIEGLKQHTDATGKADPPRSKDRVSYTHQGFQVDLTQVTPISDPKKKTHELEIELPTNQLKEEADKIDRGIVNAYEELVRPTTAFRRNITTSSARRKYAQDVPFFTNRQRLAAERTYFWANGLMNDLMGPATEGQWKSISRKQCTAILADGKGSAVKRDLHSTPNPEEKSITAQGIAKEEDILPHRRRRKQKDDTPSTLPLDASNRLTTVAGSLPINSLRRRFATYLSLSKPRLSFLIVLTTTAAYSIYPVPALLLTSTTAAPSLSTLTLFFLTTGTFLTCASANALNMLFEPEHDAKMSRTRNRPLVRKLISPRGALIFALVTGITGTAAIYAGVNPTTSALAAFNILLYAGVYTPMKRISVANTWVGALVGAIPPLMGWTAAAGQCATGAGDWKELLLGEGNAGGWLLAAYLFCWQFPHFNALSWPIRDEYKNAGYRMLAWVDSARNARVALRYSVLMFPVCIGLAYVGVVEQAFVPLSCVANGWVMYEAVKFWRFEGAKGSARSLFWASVWHLPIVLVLGMLLKKGLGERVWSSLTGVARDDDDLGDDYEDSQPRERQPVPIR
ncbi:hypothetical protein FKW77_010233 [Venturia effusa]|uniref:Protoheme IX farnesyltransferase, mitochondrial n=1 Tax=Venturia effusa TaxID=50376 RepID=A0A517L0F0_9PEZI|nr:hypothetical protein FKW77_010233 [Venturia effusa]